MVNCAHLDHVLVERPEQVAGCEECLAIGGSWVHLRSVWRSEARGCI
jgi:hypothetical protein